jgi:transcriptional regulator with XRE-family HTH domain
MNEKKSKQLKEAIGNRLENFRNSVNRSVEEMAKEIHVIPNELVLIEKGSHFPQHENLEYWRSQYDLDLNWLYTGEGSMLHDLDDPGRKRIIALWDKVLAEAGEYIDSILEIINLMRMPLTRQILLAKLVELKVLGRKEIARYFKVKDKVEIKPDETE